MRRKSRAVLVSVLAAAGLAAQPTPTARMEALLRDATAMGRTGTPAAARLEVVRTSSRDEGRLFVGREGQVAFVLARGNLRVLATAGGEAYVAQGSGSATRVAAEKPLADHGLAPADLLPFSADRYRTSHITDDNPTHMLLTLEPVPPRLYLITVVALDKEKKVPTRVQHYLGSTSNLVRLVHQSGFVEVGDAWRPTRIEITDYRDDTEIRISLDWQAGASVPAGAFDPDTFASTLVSRTRGSLH